MESLFQLINPIYCYSLAVCLFIVFIICIKYYCRFKDISFLLTGLISFGLFYDTLVTGLGYMLEPYPWFYSAGIMRHVFHTLTPLIIIIVLKAFNDCGKLLHKRYLYIAVGLAIFFSVGAIISIFTSPVNLIDYGGVLRHSIDKENAFFLSSLILKSLSYGTLIPMTAGSIVTIKYQKDYNMLISTIGMLAFTIVAVIFDAKLIFLTSFLGELILVTFFFKYSYNRYKNQH